MDIHCNVLNHLSDRHLNCSQFGAVTNSIAVNKLVCITCVHISVELLELSFLDENLVLSYYPIKCLIDL